MGAMREVESENQVEGADSNGMLGLGRRKIGRVGVLEVRNTNLFRLTDDT